MKKAGNHRTEYFRSISERYIESMIPAFNSTLAPLITHAIRIATLCLLTTIGFSASAATDCDVLDHKASESGVRIPGYMAIHKVVGRGKLQFYSAPDLTCKLPSIFILPAKSVTAYITYGKFTAVMYIHPKTKKDTEGWVLSSRLKATGYGISPIQ